MAATNVGIKDVTADDFVFYDADTGEEIATARKIHAFRVTRKESGTPRTFTTLGEAREWLEELGHGLNRAGRR